MAAWDVAVGGGGNAAREQGGRVIVLEKAPRGAMTSRYR